jgi:hypothetical protein
VDKKFEIDQLRKDKIIYGVEAAATNLVCMLVIMGVGMVGDIFVIRIVTAGAVLVGVSYTLYMGIGNYLRLKKIQELEKSL